MQVTSDRRIFALALLTALLAAPLAAGGVPEAAGGTPAPGPPGAIILPQGASMTFTDEAMFLGAANCAAVSLESFETQPATNASDQITIPATDFMISSNMPPQLGIWNMPFVGAFATDGSQWVGANEGAFITPMTVTFTFTNPIDHFGINFTDYGDFGGGNLTLTNDAGDNATAAVSGLPNGNSQFFGISNPTSTFTSVTLSHTIGGEFYGFDEVYYCLSPQDADLSLTKSANPTSANPGEMVVYTLTVSNAGPSNATGVVVTDNLPAGVTYVSDDCGGMPGPPFTWNVGALANGASAMCNVTVTVDPGASGSLVNSATVTADQPDPNPGGETATATVTAGTVLDIPTVSTLGLVVLLLLLAGTALVTLRRQDV